MTRYPKVSVIVPMYNASKTIMKCAKSILEADYPDFELIVVNDASLDDSASLACGLPCRLVKLKKNSGPGVARNEGARLASGEIVAFTDADCEVPRHWIKKIAQDLEGDDIAATSGGYSRPSNDGLVALFQFYDTSFRQRKTPKYIDSCISANFACRKRVFEEIGGFPPERINEDMLFGIALSKRHKILWDKDNGVGHHFENSLRRYFTEQIAWAQSVAILYLSSPTALFKTSTWQNNEIFIQLLFTGLLYLSLIAIYLSYIFAVPLLISYLILSVKFLRFVKREKGLMTALKLSVLLPVRNTAWMLGIIRAVFKYLKDKIGWR